MSGLPHVEFILCLAQEQVSRTVNARVCVVPGEKRRGKGSCCSWTATTSPGAPIRT